MSGVPLDFPVRERSGGVVSGAKLYIIERGDPDRWPDLSGYATDAERLAAAAAWVAANATEVQVYSDSDLTEEVSQPLTTDAEGLTRYWVAEGSWDRYVPQDAVSPIQPWEAVAALAGLTAFIRTLLDDADAATARATLEVPDEFNGIQGGTGRWYAPPCTGANVTPGSNDIIRAQPLFFGRAIAVDRLACEVVSAGAGEAGSTIRLGLYADDGTGYPGALLVDGGTVAGDSAGVKEVIVSQAVSGLIWAVAHIRGAPTTRPTLRTNSTGNLHPGGQANASAALANAGPGTGWSTTSTSATLPNPFPAGAGSSSASIRVAVRIA